MKPVPEQYRGVWARTLLETPLHTDDSTFVRWLQTSLWHADLRVSPGLSPQSGSQQLATQQGFCGLTQVNQSPQGEVCTWQRRLDFQPPRLDVDAGLMVFETPERVIETGIHASYLEVWERLPDSTGRFITLAGLDAAGHDTQQRFLVAGRYAMQVRPRSALPVNTALGQTLAEVLAQHPAQTAALLDFEISFGSLEDGILCIEQSTLPDLRGARAALTLRQLDATQARIDSPAGAVRWQILEWSCAERCL
jgi:hypothetical protein